MLLVAAACGDGAVVGGSTVAPTSSSAPSSTTGAVAPIDRGDLSLDFALAEITVAGEPWLVAVADTPPLRSRGLMFVTDLGDVDGMLFRFAGPSAGGFWMKDTLIPLDIAFFAEDGTLVDVLTMVPCGDQDPCPSYRPGGPYVDALEAPAGDLDDLGDDAVIVRGAVGGA